MCFNCVLSQQMAPDCTLTFAHQIIAVILQVTFLFRVLFLLFSACNDIKIRLKGQKVTLKRQNGEYLVENRTE